MPPVLHTDRLTLRPASHADIGPRLDIGPEPDENIRLYGIDPKSVPPFTRQSAEQWVQSLVNHPYAWVIESTRLLGSVRLDRVNLAERHASLAIGLLRADDLGVGFGTEAVSAVLRFAFTDLHLHRVAVRVLATNARAIHCYRKCGFQIEGRERETVCLDGQWQDDLIMGVLEGEFGA